MVRHRTRRKSYRKKRYPKTLHFKSKRDYERWLKYIWSNPRMRKKYAGKEPHKNIVIRGKRHKVKHPKRRHLKHRRHKRR